MKFREHRGSLEDSMKTLVELPDSIDALILHCRRLLHPFPTAPHVNDVTLTVMPYLADPRIGWTTQYLVCLQDYGVMGMCDTKPKWPS